MPRAYTADELAWLRERYSSCGLRAVEDEFEERFGYRRTRQALACKAHQLGLHVSKASGVAKSGCERKVFWSREPEMTAWMLAHDTGRVGDTVDAFEAEFGFRLTKAQVTLFRQTHGTSSRRGCNNRWGDKTPPVGTERVSKGYVVVKVAERPTVPGSKDNWPFKHVWLWEQEHGPLPDGWQVVFADKDRRNFAPENLVAIEKRICGILNQGGAEYHDAASLEVAANLARLQVKIGDARMGERACAVCGLPFKPAKREQMGNRTCPDCLAAGRKCSAPKGRATCADCGREFEKMSGNQRRCPECGTRAKSRRKRA